MNGELALLIALVSYGNEIIKDEKPTTNFDFDNSTLIYCDELKFIESEHGMVVAESPKEWFDYLKSQGCKKLEIQFSHSDESSMRDYESVAFVGGGGQWMIRTVYDYYTDFWTDTCELTNPKSVNKRICTTKLRGYRTLQTLKNNTLSTDEAKKRLTTILNKLEAFAYQNNLNYWRDIFIQAVQNLSSLSPMVDYYADFVPAEFGDIQNKQLLFSASLANVFGGMGSWNDIIFSDNEINKVYQHLSNELYDKLNDAIIASINN